jgi:pyruvate kinase
MVDSSKPASSSESSTRIKFASIFETIDVSKRRTKIVASLGDACNDVDVLVKLIDAGINVARLDFSQGDHKSNGVMVTNLQSALKQRPDKSVALMLETKGPEIRTGVLKDGKDHLIEQGSDLEIFTDYAIEGDYNRLACNYKNLPSSVSVGSMVCIGDGVVQAEVTEVCEVSNLHQKSFL